MQSPPGYDWAFYLDMDAFFFKVDKSLDELLGTWVDPPEALNKSLIIFNDAALFPNKPNSGQFLVRCVRGRADTGLATEH
jgi:hypothetical protein